MLAMIIFAALALTALMLSCIWIAVDTSTWDPKGYDDFYE